MSFHGQYLHCILTTLLRSHNFGTLEIIELPHLLRCCSVLISLYFAFLQFLRSLNFGASVTLALPQLLRNHNFYTLTIFPLRPLLQFLRSPLRLILSQILNLSKLYATTVTWPSIVAVSKSCPTFPLYYATAVLFWKGQTSKKETFLLSFDVFRRANSIWVYGMNSWYMLQPFCR